MAMAFSAALARPSPSWPSRSYPQAHTVPSLFRTTACNLPAATATTSLNPGTCAGVPCCTVVPSPSWP